MQPYYIPMLQFPKGTVEVFNTKFGGYKFSDMQHALRSVQDNPHSYWGCISQDVALMRARDKVCSALTSEKYAKDAKPAYIEVKRGSGKVGVSLGGMN